MSGHTGIGIGTALVTATLALMVLPWLWLPHDPYAMDLLRRLEPPSPEFWLGTDQLGRCVLSRVLQAVPLSLGLALMSAVVIMLAALGLGLAAALGGRWLDEAIMRTCDVILGFPTLVLALAIIGVLGASLPAVLIGLIVAWVPGMTRVVRTLALQALERDFVHAARLAGLGEWRITRRHLFPQILPPLVVLASLETAGVMLALSALSFLGLGVQPPTPEWGAMLNEARPHFESAPHLLIGPGAAVLFATLAFNLLGEGLRDRLDPRMPFRW